MRLLSKCDLVFDAKQGSKEGAKDISQKTRTDRQKADENDVQNGDTYTRIPRNTHSHKVRDKDTGCRGICCKDAAVIHE